MRGILQLMARDPSRHAHSERKCRANEKKKLLYLTYYSSVFNYNPSLPIHKIMESQNG